MDIITANPTPMGHQIPVGAYPEPGEQRAYATEPREEISAQLKQAQDEEDEQRTRIMAEHGVKSYQGGTDFVPETGPAILHKGEKVIPADQVGAETEQSQPHTSYLIPNFGVLRLPTAASEHHAAIVSHVYSLTNPSQQPQNQSAPAPKDMQESWAGHLYDTVGNVVSAVAPSVSALGREASAASNAITSLPQTLAQSIHEPFSDEEKSAYGIEGREPSFAEHLGMTIGRMAGGPQLVEAARFWKRYTQASPDEKIRLQSEMLNVAPSGLKLTALYPVRLLLEDALKKREQEGQ